MSHQNKNVLNVVFDFFLEVSFLIATNSFSKIVINVFGLSKKLFPLSRAINVIMIMPYIYLHKLVNTIFQVTQKPPAPGT